MKQLEVLCVDDEEMVRNVTVMVLESFFSGIKIDEGKSGKELLERARKKQYDLIISDNNMPELNGIDALEILRKEGYRTPAILISGLYDEQLYKRAQENHIYSMQKPYGFPELRKVIDEAIKGS